MKVLDRAGGRLIVEIDTSLYAEEAVFKCFYWYGSRFDVELSRPALNETTIHVHLRPLEREPSSEEWAGLEVKIRRDLLDFQTRHIVARETGAIRELIAAKAFSRIDPYPISPMGVNPDPPGVDATDFTEPTT